jgi:hypothetical protein
MGKVLLNKTRKITIGLFIGKKFVGVSRNSSVVEPDADSQSSRVGYAVLGAKASYSSDKPWKMGTSLICGPAR